MPNVTLNVTLKDGHLDVNQAGNPHHIPHVKTKITWHLIGPGAFNPIGDPINPGFAWKWKPHPGIFENPTVVAKKKKITIIDKNTDPNGVSSVGEWIYQLWATIRGNDYSTIYTPPKKRKKKAKKKARKSTAKSI